MSDLQLGISVFKETSFGDHAEFVRTDHVAVPGETVEDLVKRVCPELTSEWLRHQASTRIEVRVLTGADGKVTGDVVSEGVPWG